MLEKREWLPTRQGRCQHCPLVSQRVEDQVNVRKEELGELFAQMPSLDEEEGGADMSIEKRFLDLLEPLGKRKKQLESSRAKLQISRDLEDETVREPQPPAPSRCCQVSWLPPRALLSSSRGVFSPPSLRIAVMIALDVKVKPALFEW